MATGWPQTFRVGTGFSRLLSTFAATFIADRNNLEAPTNINPALLSTNMDTKVRAESHREETLCRNLFMLMPGFGMGIWGYLVGSG
jgi:hypothetical protein